MTSGETRPAESDMMNRPRLRARAESLACLADANEELRNELAETKQRVTQLAEHLRRIEELATSPAFASDVMGFIAHECWKSRTVECEKCRGCGLVGHIRGHQSKCDKCDGKGRI